MARTIARCLPQWRKPDPTPCPGPRLPLELIHAIGAFCGRRSSSRWPLAVRASESLVPATFMKKADAAFAVACAAQRRFRAPPSFLRQDDQSRRQPDPCSVPSPARRRASWSSTCRVTICQPFLAFDVLFSSVRWIFIDKNVFLGHLII